MKKLYQGKGRRVHPAPPAANAGAAAALALPAAVLALAAALTAEEQEVLAYLLSGGGGAAGGGGRRRRHGPHPPEMGCGCFGCYKSFWARWDASPNRHLIHRIIDAVEEDGGGGGGGGGGGAGTPRRHHRRRRRGRGGRGRGTAAGNAAEADAGVDHHQGCGFDDGVEDGDYEGDEDDGEEEADSIYGDESEEMMMDGSDCSNVGAGAGNAEKSTVGRLVRFIGEKVWGAWN